MTHALQFDIAVVLIVTILAVLLLRLQDETFKPRRNWMFMIGLGLFVYSLTVRLAALLANPHLIDTTLVFSSAALLLMFLTDPHLGVAGRRLWSRMHGKPVDQRSDDA